VEVVKTVAVAAEGRVKLSLAAIAAITVTAAVVLVNADMGAVALKIAEVQLTVGVKIAV
jgi:hypothetical protein